MRTYWVHLSAKHVDQPPDLDGFDEMVTSADVRAVVEARDKRIAKLEKALLTIAECWVAEQALGQAEAQGKGE